MPKFIGRLSETQIKDKESAQQQLRAWTPQHEFLCCFDVDGHLLDNMASKQIIVFQPHMMDVFGLRAVETYFRLHAEHHNLWSKDRGCDRHEAISLSLGSMLEDPVLAPELAAEMQDKIGKIKASLDGYIDHINATGRAYGFDSLHAWQQGNPGDANLTRFLIWSRAVDLTFPFVTIPMEPFPRVRETLDCVAERADVLIVSKTPYEDICNWLERHDLVRYVTAVSGKEQGGKDEHICLAMGGTFDAREKKIVRQGSKYAARNVIMGGDGGGDLEAARRNDACFFATPPAQEEEAWATAVDEVFAPFFEGRYGDVEAVKIAAFEAALLDTGPWEAEGYDHKQAYLRLQTKRQQLYRRLKPGGKLAAL